MVEAQLKARREARSSGKLLSEPFKWMTDEAFATATMKASENRFGRLKNQIAAVNQIRLVTNQLKDTSGLIVATTQDPTIIPCPLKYGNFKYSWSEQEGEFIDAIDRQDCGESVTISYAIEEDAESLGATLLGYAIASKEDGKTTFIEILDVDVCSRRSAGLLLETKIERQKFQIGIGQVLIKGILDHCHGPYETDATNPESRYIFKSLGFLHDDSESNPCILKYLTESV